MCDILHWLPARKRIEYRVAALVWRCLLGLAPVYLVELCGPTYKCAKLPLPPFSRTRSSPWTICTHLRQAETCLYSGLTSQFGMASLCRSAHSLELFIRHSFLNLRRFYLVVLGLGAPLSSPT